MHTNNVKTKLGAGILLAALIFSTYSCKKGKVEHGIITFIKGHVTLEGSSKKKSKAMLGGHVATGDTLKTGNSGTATIQIGETAVIKVEPKTTLEFTKIIESDIITLTNRRGRVFSRIQKLGIGEDFNISTPTVTAGVRGTEFMSSFDGKQSRFIVREGKVALGRTPPPGQEITDEIFKNSDQLVEAGNVAVVKAIPLNMNADVAESEPLKIDIQEQSEVDELKVEKARFGTELIVNIEKITIEEIKIKKQEEIETIKVEEKKLERKILNIENSNRPKVILELRDGNTLKGTIVSQSETHLKLDDGSDVLNIEKKDIIRRSNVEN